MTTKAVYLEDFGVKPWGSITESNNKLYRTLTIVTRSEKDMVSLLFSVFSILGSMFCNMFRWHTNAAPFSGNKIQFIKMKKDLSQNVPGCEHTYLGESSSTGIWCNTAELKLPFRKEHFDYLCGGRDTVVAITSREVRESKNVWGILSDNPEGYDCDAIYKLLQKYDDIVLAQFHDDTETHVAFQLFGSSQNIENIEKQLAPAGMTAMKERDEVVDFINKQNRER